MSSARKPNRLAPFTRFDPDVPVSRLARQAFAISFSDARLPK